MTSLVTDDLALAAWKARAEAAEGALAALRALVEDEFLTGELSDDFMRAYNALIEKVPG